MHLSVKGPIGPKPWKMVTNKYSTAPKRNMERSARGSRLDPVNLLSLRFGYCSPLVQWDCNRCTVTKVLKWKLGVVTESVECKEGSFLI